MKILSIAVQTTYGVTNHLFQSQSPQKAAEYFHQAVSAGWWPDELIINVVAVTLERDLAYETAVEKAVYNVAPERFHPDYQWIPED